jgi:ethanolamine utilization protein EutA
MQIARREILYQSPVHFTPVLDESHVDGAAIRQIVSADYERAGIRRQDVDTGAVIITGETSRKENARAVVQALSDFAGDFVVATAGPDLESELAARGAGAVERSERTSEPILHMDIGGGTSNLALIQEGIILKTGCMNVGGRLVKLGENGEISYISPVLDGLTDLKIGQLPSREQLTALAELLAQALEEVAGLRPATSLLERLWTREGATEIWQAEPGAILSFSGGVADCIDTEQPPGIFGDLGPELGQAIRRSRLCRGEYVLGRHTIRATVIGAGCHSTQLSGSTVFHQNVTFPMKGLPVAKVTDIAQIPRAFAVQDQLPVLALPGLPSPSYNRVAAFAEELCRVLPPGPVYLALEQDMAKALGQALSLRLGPEQTILCLDSLSLAEGSYLDVGNPVGPALPVIIRTLVLNQ